MYNYAFYYPYLFHKIKTLYLKLVNKSVQINSLLYIYAILSYFY